MIALSANWCLAAPRQLVGGCNTWATYRGSVMFAIDFRTLIVFDWCETAGADWSLMIAKEGYRNNHTFCDGWLERLPRLSTLTSSNTAPCVMLKSSLRFLSTYSQQSSIPSLSQNRCKLHSFGFRSGAQGVFGCLERPSVVRESEISC